MTLASGTRLGPYEILERLGAGGMGEVYRARDPRLSREVAVKLISTDGATSPDRLRRFETEARAAAQLSHPNVVTVFDVGTHEGQPYLVLELLEGETLREALHGGVPPLRQAVTWSLEISRGLAAAHERGIVHRDLKPENVFLTRDGRVKVLDFGLAKLKEPLVSDEADRESPTATKDTAPGVLLGTVGYMSPEQVKGQDPDARTDVFALGAALYEMVSGRRAFSGDSAPEVLAAILRDEPPALDALQCGVPAAVETVARRCLAKRPADRFSSARAVEAALETALSTLEPSRVSASRSIESRGPYPGLSSFTEADAERFFGRETEVEALWEKLRRGRLLAVIGPSGAGKTSFVRAGLVPARPSGWGAIVATPGGAPMRALAQALVEELPSDADTMKQLLGFEDPEVAFSMVKKWRESHLEAVLVLDQFEELFTLNPAEVQERFAELLGRLAREADVHVLLSMRDDFLMRCHEQEALVEVFEHLTPLGPLSEEGTRQALEEPAKREGFSFEDDALVDEMLESVEGARGALPLLAFAVARLWEKRDREKELLTRKAYEQIGGVAGALAQHAEQTLERIGTQREPIVRELFRNLVTAQWTRAVADRDQLLSVLPDRDVGAPVLDALIDARLLTSYEVRDSTASSRGTPSGTDSLPSSRGAPSGSASPPSSRGAPPATGDEGSPAPPEPTQRHLIEIVHESLLKAWPRLVRWQAQDEEGAVLRDQLKQAARLWEEKDRPDDLLWTGTSEREFELWRDRYPGKLTALEDEFARAMLSRAQRRKRLRRTVTASTILALLAVLAIVGAFWQRSVAESRRAEAAHLLSLARHRLQEHPTEALAYAIAGLELADRPEVRLVALEALWRGPTELRFPFVTPFPQYLDFSPDGRWLAAMTSEGGGALWPSDGGPPTLLEESEETMLLRFSPRSDLVVGYLTRGGRTLGLWSVPEGRLLRRFEVGDKLQTSLFNVSPDSQRVLACLSWTERGHGEIECYTWAIDGGEREVLARTRVPYESAAVWPEVDPAVSRLAWADGNKVRIAPLEGTSLNAAAATTLEHDRVVTGVFFDTQGRRLATSLDLGKVIQIWSLERDPPEIVRTLTVRGESQGGLEAGMYLRFNPSGSILAGHGGVLWDLDVGPDAEPLRVQGCAWELAFHPGGRWLATGCGPVSLWPLGRRYPRVLTGHTKDVIGIRFTPDGRRLVSNSLDNSLRVWPLGSASGEPSRVLHESRAALGHPTALGMAPDGSFVAFGNNLGRVLVLPLDNGPVRELSGFTDMIQAVAVGPKGRLVAAGSGLLHPRDALVRVWELATGAVRALDAGDGVMIGAIRFDREGALWVRSGEKIRRWDLACPTPRVLDEIDLADPEFASESQFRDLSQDGREVLLSREGRLWVQDLETGATREVGSVPEGSVSCAVLDPAGRSLLASTSSGAVGVASASGGEMHLLLGHEGSVSCPVASPDGQWVASGGSDGTIRLWPVPELSAPPLHTWPRHELLAKLKSLTNLRAVRDSDSPSGWNIEAGPFPGWKDVPTW